MGRQHEQGLPTTRPTKHLSKALEEYIKTIFELESSEGSACVKEIAGRLGVKAPSVTSALRKLSDAGLVEYERYKSVTLTPSGQKLARDLIRRHTVLKDFLMLIGVPEAIADIDACEIEHTVHPDTIRCLTKFIEFAQDSAVAPDWLARFREFSGCAQ